MRTGDLETLGVECFEFAQGVSFILESRPLLSATAYKILRSQEPGRFVPCVRSRLNGREKVTYLTEGLPTLASCLDDVAGRSGQRLLRSFVEAVKTVEDNGFLSVQSVLVSPDKVFVDVSTSECLLICLPLATFPRGGDIETRHAVFDLCSQACATLFGSASPLAGIERSVEYRTGSLDALRDALSRGVGEFSTAFGERCDDSSLGEAGRGDASALAGRFCWRLCSTRMANPDIVVTNPTSVVGKSPSKADKVISGNPTISRAHACLSILADGTLTAEDLGSANGTFVNDARLSVGKVVSLRPGDRIRFANVEFAVKREG